MILTMTSKTPEVVIADTSCLIVLSKANLLQVLNAMYGTVNVTPEIAEEFGLDLPNWITIEPVSDKKFLSLLNSFIDKGEASAIAFAMENEADSLLILDDSKARKLAGDMGLYYTGTLGMLAMAKNKGIISELKPILDTIITNGFRIDDKLRLHILATVNEVD